MDKVLFLIIMAVVLFCIAVAVTMFAWGLFAVPVFGLKSLAFTEATGLVLLMGGFSGAKITSK